MKKLFIILLIAIPTVSFSQKFSVSANIGWQLCNPTINESYTRMVASNEEELYFKRVMDIVPNGNISFSYLFDEKFKLGIGVSLYSLHSTVRINPKHNAHGSSQLAGMYSIQIPLTASYRVKLCDKLYIEPWMGVSADINLNESTEGKTGLRTIDNNGICNMYDIDFKRGSLANGSRFQTGTHGNMSLHAGLRLSVMLKSYCALNFNAQYSSAVFDMSYVHASAEYRYGVSYSGNTNTESEEFKNFIRTLPKNNTEYEISLRSFFSCGIGVEFFF